MFINVLGYFIILIALCLLFIVQMFLLMQYYDFKKEFKKALRGDL